MIIVTTAVLWSIYTCGYLQIPPLIIAFFHGEKSTSHFDDLEEDEYKMLHLVITILTIIVNVALKVFSVAAQRKLDKSVQNFVVFGAKNQIVDRHDEKFSFSVSSMIVLPCLILFTIITSLSNRFHRLVVFCPMQIVALNTVLPFYIIYSNQKIRRRAENLYLDVCDNLYIWKRGFLKRTSPRICPTGREVNTFVNHY